jgi:hypothetical protein
LYAAEHKVVALSDWLAVGRLDSAGHRGWTSERGRDEAGNEDELYGNGRECPAKMCDIEE